MAGTSEGGKKAAAHQDMSEKGRQGGEALASDPQKKSAASQKAADTLKRENPEHFKESGSKGGKEGGKAGGSQSQNQGGRGREEENE